MKRTLYPDDDITAAEFILTSNRLPIDDELNDDRCVASTRRQMLRDAAITAEISLATHIPAVSGTLKSEWFRRWRESSPSNRC